MRMAMIAVEIVITVVPVARIRLTTFRDGVSVTISGSGKRGGRRTQNNLIRCVRPSVFPFAFRSGGTKIPNIKIRGYQSPPEPHTSPLEGVPAPLILLEGVPEPPHVPPWRGYQPKITEKHLKTPEITDFRPKTRGY